MWDISTHGHGAKWLCCRVQGEHNSQAQQARLPAGLLEKRAAPKQLRNVFVQSFDAIC